MLIFKVIFPLSICIIFQLIFAGSAFAWGPAIHTVIACRIIEEANQLLPAIASIIQSFSLEYVYGSMAADFFVGKGQKKKKGHSHNWGSGFRLLDEVVDEREAAYAYGFFSHLAADIVAHNYFVPDLIHRVSIWKKIGHLYSEAIADYFVGPFYMRIARDILSMEQLDCDHLLKSALGKNSNGLKARRHIFTQSVKLSDYIYCSPPMFLVSVGSRYGISNEHLNFMINLSYRLVRDFLTNPDSSPCLSYDPIGSRNLRLARRNGIFSKLFNITRPVCRFPVDQELLEL